MTRSYPRGHFKSYVSGIKFLYNTTLNRQEVVEDISIPRPRSNYLLFWTSRRRSIVFLLRTTSSQGDPDDHLFFRTQDQRGVTFEDNDIDSKRMMVRVEQGKGGKDRYTILATDRS